MKKQKTTTDKRRVSLRTILNTAITAAWIIPIGVFTWFIFFNYQKAYMERSDSLIKNAVEVSGVLVVTDIDEAITKLQKPTYEGEWERGYAAYSRGSKSRNQYLVSLKASLISKYYMDNQITRYAFYLEDDQNPTCYAGKTGYSYTNFLTHVQPVALELAKKDSNYAEVHVIDNQIYVMRNVYTVNDYRRYGTLVLGLDKNAIFDELPLERPEDVRICFFGDKECLALDNTDDRNADTYSFLRLNSESATGQSQILSLESGTNRGYAYTANTDDYMMSLFYITPTSELYVGIDRLNLLVALAVLSMIPIILLMLWLLRIHLQRPLQKMEVASHRLREGELGITLPEKSIPNREFAELIHSFNAMSTQLKYLFDTVYMEKMATKDAQIAALQAQINPHFLNNTLEMMNWQARMNKDIETSKMIEALGTVLDSSMNRNNDRLVRLSDEIRCGEAFLYIMSMRFGKRLKVERDIRVDTMQVMVPGLILQPLLENAIRHGIEKVSSGTIWVNIYPHEDKIHIDVVNTGKLMTEAELKRVEDIIQGRHIMNKSEPGVHTSIGIYNVNKRIQLIYGTDYGLTITQKGDLVTSRIVIPENYKETEGSLDEENRAAACVLSALVASGMLASCGEDKIRVESVEKSSDQTVIRTVTMFGGSDPGAVVYENLLHEFMEENPDIRVEDESGTSDEQWKASVVADFAAGNEPDVLQFFTDATANQLVAMDKFVSIEEIRALYPDYAKDTKIWALEQVTNADGVMRAVPTTGIWEGLYVNEDLFERYKIPLPEDWDSFVNAIEQFRERDIVPVACSLSNVPHYWLEYLLLCTAGEESYLNAEGEVSEKWIEALDTFAVLREMGAFPENTDSITNEYAQELFKNKKAAMLLEGSWYLPAIEDKVHTIVMPFPGVEGKKLENGVIIGGMTSGFYITRRAWDDPKKRDAAVRYVMSQTDRAAVQRYYENGGGIAVAATEVSQPKVRSRLEKCAAAYAAGNEKKVLPTDSRMDPEAYTALIAGISEVSLGSSSRILLEHVFSIASQGKE